MIGLLGYNFCADKNAIDPMPTNVAKLSIVQIEGGIFDHINITSKTDGEYSEIPPTTWDFSTILDCDFNDNISGGNIGDISKDTTLVRIKRRVKGTYKWATIKEVPITKDEDLSFAFTDNLNLNNTTYEYAYVPVAGNQEGGYTIKTYTLNSRVYLFVILTLSINSTMVLAMAIQKRCNRSAHMNRMDANIQLLLAMA